MSHCGNVRGRDWIIGTPYLHTPPLAVCAAVAVLVVILSQSQLSARHSGIGLMGTCRVGTRTGALKGYMVSDIVPEHLQLILTGIRGLCRFPDEVGNEK